jgi:hypothetical protein
MDSIRLCISECLKTLEFAETLQTVQLHTALCATVRDTLHDAANKINGILTDTAGMPPLEPIFTPIDEDIATTTVSSDPFEKYREFLSLMQNRVCARFPSRSRKECKKMVVSLYHKFKGEATAADMVKAALADLDAQQPSAFRTVGTME